MRRLLFLLIFVLPLLTFQQGCAFMQNLLGVESNSEEESTPPPANYEQASDRYFHLIETGWRTGVSYVSSEAEEWLIKNATPEQKYKIGSKMFAERLWKLESEGSCKDDNDLFVRRIAWLEMAAEENVLRAQRSLGNVYKYRYWRGKEGCEAKEQDAVKWMRKVVENWGNEDDQDVETLEEVLGLAVTKEDDQHSLATAYFEGLSGESYKKQGLEMLKRLSIEGHSTSQLHLASAYEEGKGVSLSHKQAYIWYYVEFLDGRTNLIEKISHLRNILETGEIVSAEATARKIFREIARKKADKNNK